VHRQPRLSDSTWTDQRHEADVSSVDQGENRGGFLRSAHEGSNGLRQSRRTDAHFARADAGHGRILHAAFPNSLLDFAIAKWGRLHRGWSMQA
jgi:hypothetical protein